MTKFQDALLKQQFLLRYGALLSNKLIGELAPSFIDVKELIDNEITDHRDSDTKAILDNQVTRSDSNIGVARELASNIGGFVDVFTAKELDAIWKETVSTIPVSFAEIKKSREKRQEALKKES